LAPWVEATLKAKNFRREDYWIDGLPVGNQSFLEEIKSGLGFKDKYRDIEVHKNTHVLQEPIVSYLPSFRLE